MTEGIWLLRHGALAPNPERRFIGQRDLPLSAKGRQQALLWAQRLLHMPFMAIVSSDLARCVETARLVKGKRTLPLVLEPALREISLGAWEGLTQAEVEERFPGGHAARGMDMAHYQPHGGESFACLAARALPAFEQWRKISAGQALLIVAHSGVNRVLIAHALALPLQSVLEIPQPYACCTHFALN